MGELVDQLFAGGPGLTDLTPEQQDLFREQSALDGGVRWNIHRLNDSNLLRDAVAERCGGLDVNETSILIRDYGEYVLLVSSDRTGPLTEDEFRDLLAWCGHTPSATSDKWIGVFQAAVKRQREFQEWVLNERIKYAPENTFLQRVVDAAE